ncbi:MAG: hypothetical protein FWD92_06705, partial [Methanomassiliicoccaceae archaeon]|nr:hypothetical protein [Methanomassiliicoccaceae archaeon]
YVDTQRDSRVLRTTLPNLVYGTDNNGTASNRDVSTNATANHIVQRTTGGQITVPQNPSANTDATSRHYVDTQRDSRVARVDTANIVYGTGNNNVVSNRAVSTNATANHIVQRTTGGQITVPQNPSANTDAASRQYVDSNPVLYAANGTCSTNAATLATGINGAAITEGSRIRVRFTAAINQTTGTSLTVNGASSVIQINGAVISTENPLTIPVNESRVFVRAGSVWQMMTDGLPLWLNRQGEVVINRNPNQWREVWVGRVSSGTITIPNILTIIQDPVEIMLVAESNGGGGGGYIYNTILPFFTTVTGVRRQRMWPSPTTSTTIGMFNAVKLVGGETQWHWVRFNSYTQIQLVSGAASNLVGVYVR